MILKKIFAAYIRVLAERAFIMNLDEWTDGTSQAKPWLNVVLNNVNAEYGTTDPSRPFLSRFSSRFSSAVRKK